MKRQNGFIPLFILLFVGATITAGALGYSYVFRPTGKIVQNNQEDIPSFSLLPTASPTPSLKPKPTSLIPTYRTPTTIQSTGTIYTYISDNGNPITDNSLQLYIRNENTGDEQIMKNTTSSWTVSGIKPGKYKMYIPYSYKQYFNPERNCEGCRDKEDVSDFGKCGYVVNLHAGDIIKFSCSLRTTHQLNIPPSNISNNSSGPDTMPPNTNIYYPQPNGSITYKMDGKVCAIASEPNDNQGPNGIETEYRFDEGPWSGYAAGRAFLCADSLPNGPHTLSYYSKDKAGNVESTKTLQFTVNIP